MNLETTYLGLRLKNPLVPSASPLSSDVDNVKRMEDAGFAVMLKFGKQWVFDDSFLVDVFWGFGYGVSSQDDGITYGFVAGNKDIPLSATGGIRLGWTF